MHVEGFNARNLNGELLWPQQPSGCLEAWLHCAQMLLDILVHGLVTCRYFHIYIFTMTTSLVTPSDTVEILLKPEISLTSWCEYVYNG